MNSNKVLVFITANPNYTLSSSTSFYGYARKITASVMTSDLSIIFALLSTPPGVPRFNHYNLQSIMVIIDS